MLLMCGAAPLQARPPPKYAGVHSVLIPGVTSGPCRHPWAARAQRVDNTGCSGVRRRHRGDDPFQDSGICREGPHIR